MGPHSRRILAALLAVLAGTACRGAPAPRSGPAQPSPLPSTGLEAAYRARLDSARTRFTDADVRFMSGMISHHAQALVMAGLATTRVASESVRTLAARITNAQKDEIAAMQQWLRDRGQPVPEIHGDGTSLVVHGVGHDARMPGMLTAEQLAQLERASGPDFDRLFLTYMILHHRGAVTMVHELFETDGAGQDEAVFKLASDIQVDQLTEIARMERMLAAMSPDGRRP